MKFARPKRKIILQVFLVLFLVVSIFLASTILIPLMTQTVCDGYCGRHPSHGGMLTAVCPDYLFPTTQKVAILVVGGLGVVISTTLLVLSCIFPRRKPK
jgi:hypothetical protein